MHPDSPKFLPFGPDHLAVLGFVLCCSVLFMVLGHRCSIRHARIGGVVLAVLVFGWAIASYGYKFWSGTFNPQDSMPLHLCYVILVTTTVALIFRKQLAFEMTYYWGLAGTLHALFTPDLHQGFPTWPWFQFWWLHAGIIISIFYLIGPMGMRPRKGSVLRLFLWIQVYVASVGVLDALFGWNYGYLCWKPLGPSLLDSLGPHPYYLFALEIFALLSFGFYHLPWIIWSKSKGVPLAPGPSLLSWFKGKTACGIFMLLLLALVSSCSKPIETQGKIRIICGVDDSFAQSFSTQITLYRKYNPQLDIEIVTVPTNELVRYLENNPASADIVIFDHMLTSQLAWEGKLLPLDKAATDVLKDMGGIPLKFQMAAKYKGQIYGIPLAWSGTVLFFNKKHFDKAKTSYPNSFWNWEDFTEASHATTWDVDYDGTPDLYGFEIGTTFYEWAPFVMSFESETRAEGKMINLGGPEVLIEQSEALQFYGDLAWQYKVAPQPDPKVGSLFTVGKTSMSLGSTVWLETLVKQKDLKWGMSITPKGKRNVSFIRVISIGLAAQSKYPSQSAGLIAFLSRPESREYLARHTFYFPATTREAEIFLNENAEIDRALVFPVYEQLLSEGTVVPSIVRWPQIEAAANAETARFFNKTTTAPEALKAIHDKIETLGKE
ncbi:MAG: TIGR02206 family membrane protein [Verrucomicrobiota bacterium]|nr:TIGR02206 family membrane protein [Verrucomicrobiota bacterium]